MNDALKLKIAAGAALAAVVVLGFRYVAGLTGKAVAAGQDALKPATDKAFDVWQKINPPQYPEFNQAGFVLLAKYVLPDYKLSAQYRHSMELAHKDNGKLLAQLLDFSGKIKPQYRHLIGQQINERVLNG